MAGSSNFLIFDESKNNVMSDADYQSASQRQSGVIPGVVDPALHNKIYRQASVMAYAIATVMAERGATVNDANPSGVVSAVRKAFAYSVNGDKPDQSGAIQTGKPIDAWPIGSIYISAVNTNPATMLGGGTWQRIKGTFLLAADDSNYTLGNSYGSMTKTLTTANLPSHSHSATVGNAGGHSHTVTIANAGAHTHTASSASAGGHTHTASSASAGGHTHTASSNSKGAHTHSVTGSTGSAGAHSHGRGTLNITGYFGLDDMGAQYHGGAFYATEWGYNSGAQRTEGGPIMKFDATYCPEWVNGATSEASAHAHSVSLTAASAGGHSHTITVESASGHTHNVTVNSAGAHSHNITVNEAAAHTHGTTVSNVAAHKHTVTIGDTGSGTAVNVVPKSLAVYVWKRTA